MKVAIISNYSFPNGMAASNRIIAYSKGLISNNASVQLICTEPIDNYVRDSPLPDKGEFKGIQYIYPSGRYKSRYKIFRGISIKTGYRFLWGGFNVARYLFKNRFDAILISNDTPKFLFLYSVLAKMFCKKVIFVFDEYPTPIRHFQKTDIPSWKKKAYRLILPRFSGYISISQRLADYYTHYIKKPFFIMPIIVDTDKFGKVFTEKYTTNRIIYVGNMELTKDNVDLIIKAFARILPHHNDLQLDLYGTPSKENLLKLNRLIEDLKLQEHISFKGRIPSEEVPAVLRQAQILVSSQPDTVRAEGGFPTKLGEYLAMGIPTLISNVGENAFYVKAGQECFFAEPDNIEAYAEKLEYILSNYEEALIVADRGKQLIQNKYSHVSVGTNLIKFINNI